jgi:hypothetical protein
LRIKLLNWYYLSKPWLCHVHCWKVGIDGRNRARDRLNHRPYYACKLGAMRHANKTFFFWLVNYSNKTFAERMHRFNWTRSAGSNNSSMSGIRPLKAVILYPNFYTVIFTLNTTQRAVRPVFPWLSL